MAQYFEKVLTDAWESVGIDRYEVASSNLVGYEGPPWRITKFPLRGGRQEGVQLVQIDNGSLSVVVVPTRGMAVLEAFTDTVSMGWDSPVQELVHPSYVNPAEYEGLGWLAGFNEFICRCGLAYQGAPGTDRIITATQEELLTDLPLHGEIANTPAMRLKVRVQLQPPYELGLVGEVREARMFGPALHMVSTLSTVPGSREFTIRDVVENQAATAAELELLYHCNYGPPLLGEGARLLAPVAFVCPRDEIAQAGMEEWQLYGAPEAGFAEQCYFLRLHGDDEGNTVVALLGREEQMAATIRFSVEQLPAFTIWKFTAAESDGYVTGLEPGIDYPNNRSFERSKGRVAKLPAHDSYQTSLTFALHETPSEVQEVKQEIEELSEGRETVVGEEPDPDYCP